MFMPVKKRTIQEEKGAVMLEGMLVMVITMIVLVWLMALGFVYYQRYTTTVVTNDAAVKIAATYNNPTSDIIMGYVTTEDISGRPLYRGFGGDSNLSAVNKERAAEYIRYMLNRTNFAGVLENVDVEMELVQDSYVRKHVELTVTCTYHTPFGMALEFFGMDGRRTYSVTACSDCTDVAEYYSTVHFANTLMDGSYLDDGSGIVHSIIELLNSLVSTYNQFFS